MSGHSHWAGIKHKKGLADAKRSQVFSKLTKELTVAAREGLDPDANPRLRSVIDKAREANMPSDNIERAIKKASGADAQQLEEILIEAYGPGGIALLVEAITDNKNRTVGEIKQILTKNQGKFVEEGAVRWLFERKGVVTVEPTSDETPLSTRKDELELLAIDGGAENFFWGNGLFEVYATPSSIEGIKQVFIDKGFGATTSLDWVPKERLHMEDTVRQQAERLFEALEEHDDVQGVFSNT